MPSFALVFTLFYPVDILFFTASQHFFVSIRVGITFFLMALPSLSHIVSTGFDQKRYKVLHSSQLWLKKILSASFGFPDPIQLVHHKYDADADSVGPFNTCICRMSVPNSNRGGKTKWSGRFYLVPAHLP